LADHRQSAPAALRNRDPILDVLRKVLPRDRHSSTSKVLEIASGTGEHVVHFARHLSGLTFQPSDPSPDALKSIDGWMADAELRNILPPLLFDAAQDDWPFADLDGIICINMIHIAPWRATEGLLRGAAQCLASGAPLYLYGPYRQSDVATADSNEAFDTSLKARNAEWGLRDLDIVAALAASNGFSAPQVTQMPANNLSVVFRRN
jgi:SAM-dependent methyltransferase